MPERSEFLSDKLFHVGDRVSKHQDQMRFGNLPGAPETENAAQAVSPEQQAARLRRLEEVLLTKRDLEQRLAKALIATEESRIQAEAAAETAVKRLKFLQERQQELAQLTIPEAEPLPSPAEIGACFREVDRLKLEYFRDEVKYTSPEKAEPRSGSAPNVPVPEGFGRTMLRGLAFTLPLMLILLLTAAVVCGFFFWLWS